MEKKIEILFLLTGPNGAGKGTITALLKEKFLNIMCYEMREEIRKIGTVDGQLFLNREDFTNYTTVKRIEHGPDYFMNLVLNKTPITRFALVDSMRHPSEYQPGLLHADRVYVVAVLSCPLDASPEEKMIDLKRRYDRLIARKTETDKFESFEEFVGKDAKEWRPENPNDPNAHNVEACVTLALENNFVILNDGDIDSLRERFNTILFNLDLLPAI